MPELLVTICITTYNRKKLLPFALDSILNQSYKNFEIIIVDDFSSDGTEQLINNDLLKLDTRIKYIRHKKNYGLSVSRNSAIFSARGKYFTFCDDDDEWDTTFLEKFIYEAKKYNNKWCFCCGTKYLKNNKSISIIYKMDGKLIDYIRDGYIPPVAAQFYNTEELKKVGGYNEDVKSGVDHDLWLKLAYSGCNIKSIEEALSYPNTNAYLGRMTNIKSKRKVGINKSLKVWEDDMVKFMGKRFYKNFCDKYYDNLLIIDIKEAIKSKNMILIIKLFFSIKHKILFFKFLLNSINRKIFFCKNRIIIDKGLFGG